MGVKPITAKAAKSCATNTMAKQTGEVKGSKYSEADVIIGTAGGQNIFGTKDVYKDPDTPGTDATMGYSGGGTFKNKEEKDWYNNQIQKRISAGMSQEDAVQDYRDTFKIGKKDVVLDPGTKAKEGEEYPETTPDYEKVDGMTVYNMRRDARREKVAERMANQAARQAARLRKRETRLKDREKYEKAKRIGKKAARRETREKKMQERLDQFDVQRKQGSFGSRDYRTLKVGEDEKAFTERQESYQNPDRTYGTDITDLERAKTFVGKSGKNTLEFVKKGIKQIYGTRN